jgi:hypothetical protein
MTTRKALVSRIAPSVPFTLEWENADGSKQSLGVRLAYDLNALAIIEEKLGLSPTVDVEEIFFSKPTVKCAQVLLYAALQLNHEDDFPGEDGYKAVGSVLTLQTMGAAKDACWEAYLGQLKPEAAQKFRDALKALLEGRKAEAAKAEQSPLGVSPSENSGS